MLDPAPAPALMPALVLAPVLLALSPLLVPTLLLLALGVPLLQPPLTPPPLRSCAEAGSRFSLLLLVSSKLLLSGLRPVLAHLVVPATVASTCSSLMRSSARSMASNFCVRSC